MKERLQQTNENLDNYFQEKVKLCSDLDIEISEIREEVLIGLRSKRLCDAIFLLKISSIEELLHKIHEHQTLETKRSERIYGAARGDTTRRADTLKLKNETYKGKIDESPAAVSETFTPNC